MPRTSKLKQNNNETKWNIALYVRLSNDDKLKNESESIKSQKLILEKYVSTLKNANSYKFYVDDGFSGGNFNRPSFQKMLEEILSKNINCVIVKDISRFGRNFIEVSKYLQVSFPILKVRFISINENIDTENDTSNFDTLSLGFCGLMNEEYLKDCSIKSKLSYKIRQNNGYFTAPFAPYGYKKDNNDLHKLVIDNEVKSVVEFIFKDYIKKKSFNQVAKDLSKKNILSPSEYKQKNIENYPTNKLTTKKFIWNSDTISTILKNQVYIGNLVQHKREITNYKTKKCKKLPSQDWIIIENTHDAIIDKKTFEKVQNIMKNNKKAYFIGKNTQPDNYFSGIIFCGKCNSKMTYVNDKNRKYTFYKCKLKSMSTTLCDSEIIKTETISNVVLKTLQTYITLMCNFDLMQNNLIKSKIQNIKSKQTIPKDFETQKELLYNDYKNKIITLENYIEQKNNLEKEQALTNQNQFSNNSKLQTNPNINESISELFEYKKIKALNKELVKALIKKIIVHSSTNIEIIFNFQNKFDLLKKEDLL